MKSWADNTLHTHKQRRTDRQQHRFCLCLAHNADTHTHRAAYSPLNPQHAETVVAGVAARHTDTWAVLTSLLGFLRK